jgi:hypothetical protein
MIFSVIPDAYCHEQRSSRTFGQSLTQIRTVTTETSKTSLPTKDSRHLPCSLDINLGLLPIFSLLCCKLVVAVQAACPVAEAQQGRVRYFRYQLKREERLRYVDSLKASLCQV